MNRRSLIAAVAKETEFSKVKSARAVNSLLDIISHAIVRKEKVTLAEFGTFFVVTRKPRNARNPRTGEKLVSPKKTVPRWRASEQLQIRVR